MNNDSSNHLADHTDSVEPVVPFAPVARAPQAEHVEQDEQVEHWREARRLRVLNAFMPAALISTIAGSSVVVVGLWSVAPHGLLVAWYYAGLLLIGVQWRMWLTVEAGRAQAAAQSDGRRHEFTFGSLFTGLYWFLAGVALFPEGSLFHQVFLACVIAAVSALWLPLFAVERNALVTVAAPALLPMGLSLLTSPSAPLTIMGSVLFLLFAALFAVALVFKRILDADYEAQRALYHRATHDSLVGLVNHAEFHRRMQALEASPYPPFAVVFIDLDHFKDVNDTLGHAGGDRVLREVGAIVRQEIRKTDVGARVGGDEFAVLMPLCTDREARRVALAIRDRIARLAWLAGCSDCAVTASIGIACSSEGGRSAQGVLQAADEACYSAKRAGRNRVEAATGANRCGSAFGAVQTPYQRLIPAFTCPPKTPCSPSSTRARIAVSGR